MFTGGLSLEGKSMSERKPGDSAEKKKNNNSPNMYNNSQKNRQEKITQILKKCLNIFKYLAVDSSSIWNSPKSQPSVWFSFKSSAESI